jgi:hypothetical protein
MTRLLLLSVQCILKNLNKIRREILHLSERPLNALNKPRQASIELGRNSQKNSEEITHTFEGMPTERRRSMRLGRLGRQLSLNLHVIGVEHGDASIEVNGGILFAKTFESAGP